MSKEREEGRMRLSLDSGDGDNDIGPSGGYAVIHCAFFNFRCTLL